VNPTHVMGRRVVAFIIDAVLLTAVFAGLFLALANHSDQALSLTGTNLHVTVNNDTYYLQGDDATSFYVIEVLIGLLYAGVIQGLTGGTIGKLICGIRVMREDGSRPGIGRGVLRWVLLIVDDFPYFIPMLTGFIVALTNDRRQRVGDLAAGTFVVRAGTAAVPTAVATPPPAVAPAPPVPASGTAPPTPQMPAAQPPAPQPTPAASQPSAPEPAAPAAQPTAAQSTAAQPTATQPTAPQQPSPQATPPVAPPMPPANWYPDPSGNARLRYWDGARWTDHTAQ
jgi:uncharacterized RDD family membrane protein YckC